MTRFFLSQIQGLDPLTSSEVLVAQNVFFALIALVMILAALRMVTTENIVHAGLEIWSDPIDIDVHLFVNRSASEPSHLHLDVRYLVKAPPEAIVRGNEESQALKWVKEEELTDSELSLDESTQRLARCGFALADQVLG